MDRFLVISPHCKEDCARALKETLAIGYLTHFDWGCRDGEHTGWAIVEAESKAQAMMSVPAYLRGQAHVVRISKFSPNEVLAMHIA